VASTPIQQSPLSNPINLEDPPPRWREIQVWEVGGYYRARAPFRYRPCEVDKQRHDRDYVETVGFPRGSYARCVAKDEQAITVPTNTLLTSIFVTLEVLTPTEQVVRVGFFPGIRGDTWMFERIENELLILALAAKGLA
jgi:hypothetical protein